MTEERRASHIDPIQFGELLGSMKHLTKAVEDLTTDVIELKAKLNTGKGMAMGLLVAAAGIGGTVGAIAHKFFDVLK